MSAGVDGMTTVRPGMWHSSASRLWECWLPDERPAPNCVRTVSPISAAPPVMNGSFAAWLSNWSKHTPRKSRYIISTTGRMPAIAAPTPSPTIAVSEIGVSRTRSPNRSARPRVSPKTLPPEPTSIPATKTRSSLASSISERVMDRIHRAEHRRVLRRSGRLDARRSSPYDEVHEGRRRRAREATGRIDGLVELAATPSTRVRRSRRRAPQPLEADLHATGWGLAASTRRAPRVTGTAVGRPRSGRASDTSRPRRPRDHVRRAPRRSRLASSRLS